MPVLDNQTECDHGVPLITEDCEVCRIGYKLALQRRGISTLVTAIKFVLSTEPSVLVRKGAIETLYQTYVREVNDTTPDSIAISRFEDDGGPPEVGECG